MSQCVPSWDLDETNNSARIALQVDPNAQSTAPDEAMLDYEVAELTWESGHPSMHGLGPPRLAGKPFLNYTWEKPRARGTLESIVDQATCVPPPRPSLQPEDLLSPFDPHSDLLVPCTSGTDKYTTRVPDPKRVDLTKELEGAGERKRKRVARAAQEEGWGASATLGMHVTGDTCEMEVGCTSTSLVSSERASSEKALSSRTMPATVDDHISIEVGSKDEEKGKTGKSSVSTNRGRAAAIHNQSERKRRDKINQKMKTLQKLVPNSSKTDKASILDEVIDYLKQLQAQVQMINKMNSIPQMNMLMPMSMQHLQMSMMAQMGMGMGMMDMNSINRPGHPTTMPPVIHPAAFLPMTAGNRLPLSGGSIMQDPFSNFLACQTQQPMNLEAYSRMAALFQQLQQPTPSPPPNS